MDFGHPIIDVQLPPYPVEYQAPMAIPAAGAECVFLGRTRHEQHPQHGALLRLTYEAYQPLAQHVLTALADQAINRFGCLAVRLHHALGDVPVGRASVLVQVCCGHRDAAFDACRMLIDALKRTAPIWKREVWARGETWPPGHTVRVDAHPAAPLTQASNT